MMLTEYAFWAAAGYTACAVIGSLAALAVTVAAVQLSRLVKGRKNV